MSFKAEDMPPLPHSLPECRTEGFDLLYRPVWILDMDAMRKFYANGAARALWRVEPGEEAEFFARDFAPHSPAIRSRLTRTMERLRAGEVFTERWTFYPKSQPFTAACLMSGVRLPNGHAGMLVEAMVAETEPEDLRALEALRHTGVLVTLYDEAGAVLYQNPAAARGYPGEHHRFIDSFAVREEGRSLWEAAFRHDPARTNAFMGQTVSGEFRVLTSAGERWHGIDLRTTTDPVSGHVGALVNERDITEQMRAKARSEYLSTHDMMTDLLNRTTFVERLQEAMEQPGAAGALLMIDLDNFKEVNDTYGHAAGDGVLREIGARLRASLRPGDVAARLGGDEFALLLAHVVDAEVLRRRASEIDLRLIQPIADPVSGAVFSMAASFGIATWPEDGESPDTLQRNADLALYAAKTESGRRVRRFNVGMRREADERHQCILDLSSALEHDEFEMFYQPIVDLATLAPKGFEALLRWRHPTRGLLLPDYFIPAAESVGLMAPIGTAMFARICAQVRAWIDEGLDPGRVAVNLSANQFRNRALPDHILAELDAAGLTPARIEFEVPETVTLGRSGEAVVDTLSALRRAGFSIALDDFGTGHASLTHLRRLPVDVIKIDRSFIADMEHSAADRAIVHAVIALGRELGMSVLAEGIENEGQRASLHLLGCHLAQGYLFGHPMQAARAAEWMQRQAARLGAGSKVITFPAAP
ncbi:putative bifunctional diguanylate cyclase/phosphodiesterase [Ancylobacter radicis]|uniref:EAL domain-containing protein n=1 Tax=Ancylobacter radicis TaxID=2836179 RepID=A0ABS5R3X7_9HYPH|nr:EAL domain-containing protein [Ancylobacter radicis]MBS9475621.1 EAL domain-containing protein [Ancylobacter radicis]